MNRKMIFAFKRIKHEAAVERIPKWLLKCRQIPGLRLKGILAGAGNNAEYYGGHGGSADDEFMLSQ